jgi:hypothetical protein
MATVEATTEAISTFTIRLTIANTTNGLLPTTDYRLPTTDYRLTV